MKYKATGFQWTKDKIKSVIKLWNSSTVGDIAEEIGATKVQVSALGGKLRKLGYDLPNKRVRGVTDHLLREVLSEIKPGRRS